MAVYEIKYLHEVLPLIKKEALIFFDLDNTLLEPVHEFGSIQWEEALVRDYIKKGIPEDEAHKKGSLIWRAVQTIIEIKLVEENTHLLINTLKEKGHLLFGLTARSRDVSSLTAKQLDTLGIEFHKSGHPPTHLAIGAHYSDGVIHCGDTDKAPSLHAFLNHANLWKDKIVMIDDKRQYLDSAEHFFKALDVDFLGLRYGYLDERVAQYTPDFYSELFHKILTHPTARDYLLQGL